MSLKNIFSTLIIVFFIMSLFACNEVRKTDLELNGLVGNVKSVTSYELEVKKNNSKKRKMRKKEYNKFGYIKKIESYRYYGESTIKFEYNKNNYLKSSSVYEKELLSILVE